MPPVFREPLPGGWVELSLTPSGWHARRHARGEDRANKRHYPSPVAALVALERGHLDDPAYERLLDQVRHASLDGQAASAGP
jgi:hypothetical protein